MKMILKKKGHIEKEEVDALFGLARELNVDPSYIFSGLCRDGRVDLIGSWSMLFVDGLLDRLFKSCTGVTAKVDLASWYRATDEFKQLRKLWLDNELNWAIRTKDNRACVRYHGSLEEAVTCCSEIEGFAGLVPFLS